jgi:hypothetical protein
VYRLRGRGSLVVGRKHASHGKRKTRLTGKNVAVKTERLFFAGRKTVALFFGNRPFFRGPKNRVTVFRTVFLRKMGKAVIFKEKQCDTPLFFFFGPIRDVLIEKKMWTLLRLAINGGCLNVYIYIYMYIYILRLDSF